MNPKKLLKGVDFNIVSIIAMGLAAAASLVGDYDKERKTRTMIKELVSEELEKRGK